MIPNAPLDRPDRQGWVNANLFEGLTMLYNDIFIDFVMDGPYTYGYPAGIFRNSFMNIDCQSGSNTLVGVRNISHVGNSFINVNIWDIERASPGAAVSSIHPDARGTIIISGLMTGHSFSDQGIATKIIDAQT